MLSKLYMVQYTHIYKHNPLSQPYDKEIVMTNKSSSITECLLTTVDFNYIIALNEFNSSKSNLLNMKESAVALTVVIFIFLAIAAFLMYKARKHIDILIKLPFVVVMSAMVVNNVYQYWILSSLEDKVVINQQKFDETPKASRVVEEACATQYKNGGRTTIRRDITLKKIPSATESEIITGIKSK